MKSDPFLVFANTAMPILVIAVIVYFIVRAVRKKKLLVLLPLFSLSLLPSCTKDKTSIVQPHNAPLLSSLGFDPAKARVTSVPHVQLKEFKTAEEAKRWLDTVRGRIPLIKRYAQRAPTTFSDNSTADFMASRSDVYSSGNSSLVTIEQWWFLNGVKVTFTYTVDTRGNITSVTSPVGSLYGATIGNGFQQDIRGAYADVLPDGSIVYAISGVQYFGVSIDGHAIGITTPVVIRGSYNPHTRQGSVHYGDY